MVSVLPANIHVQHLPYQQTDETDSRGNQVGSFAAPVDRYVIGFYRLHWADPHPDPISLDFEARTIADLVMLTTEPNVYHKFDRVLLFDGSEWLAYEVQNQTISWASGYTWQKYSSLLAGEVHIRRVQ